MMNLSKYRSAAVVFGLGFLWAFFLLQDLPFTFGDDLNTLDFARHASWRSLITGMLNPWTPAWYVHGRDSLLSTRVGHAVFFKAVYSLFGHSPNAFHALGAFGFSMIGTFTFLLLNQTTRNAWLALGGSLFFFLLLPVYQTLAWIADFEILCQMFVIVSVWIFLRVYNEEARDWPLLLIFLIASAWVGFKLKETTRILPFIFLGFILLHQNRRLFNWLTTSLKNKLLLAAACFLFLPVIPFFPDRTLPLDERSTGIFTLNFDNLSLVFPVLFKLMGVYWVFLGAIFLLTRFVSRREGGPKPPFLIPEVFFLSIWFGGCFLATLLNFRLENNLRYLTTSLVPLTLLLFTLCGRALLQLTRKKRRVFGLIFAVLLAVSLQRNLDEIIFHRIYFNGFDIADYKLTKKIYEDRYGVSSAAWRDLDDFFRGRQEPSLKSAFTDLKIIEWDEKRAEFAAVEHLEKVAKEHGAAYILSFRSDLYSGNPRAALIYQSTTRTSSLFDALISKIKKKSSRPIYLYKFS